jgi:beta-lactamase class A
MHKFRRILSREVLALTAMACLHVQPAMATQDPVIQTAKQVQEQLKARLGLAVYDSGTGQRWRYNADEHFPMTSTFKVLLCATLLSQDKLGTLKVPVTEEDMVSYSPVTRDWIGKSVALNDLCAATMSTSDNTAANLVLKAVGGPEAVTAFVRELGDTVTRLDNWEPEVNEARPGDLRNTTTPDAMLQTLQTLLLEKTLSRNAQKTLTQWLESNAVSGPVLRAGLPENWRTGDRTGAGDYGSRGIVAIIWPPKRAPLIAVIYITQTKATMAQRNAAIAEIGKALVKTITTPQ